MSTLKTNNIQHVDRSDPSIIISTDGGVSIAGTLTYEDVTNVDAVGIVTGRELINAQKQIHVGTGVSVKAGGLNVTAGITTVQALQATTGTFTGDVTVTGTTPSILLTDTDNNPDYLIKNGNGEFNIQDATASANRLSVNSSGNVVVGSDLIIPDKIVHASDTDTAIRFPTADAVSVETGGSERLRIDSGGKIGIGTDNPHVTGLTISGANARLQLISPTTGGASGDGVIFGLDGSQDYFINNRETGKHIKFFTESTERLRISSDGQLIHNANKASGYIAEFHQDNSSNSAQILIDSPTDSNVRPTYVDLAQGGTVKWSLGQAYASSASQAFHIATSSLGTNESGSKVTIKTDGMLGIGTHNPNMTLHVLSSSDDVARFQSTNSGNGAAISLDHIGSSPADNDIVGKIVFNGQDDAFNTTTYADIRCISSDVSNGSETAHIDFGTRGLNSFNPILRLNARSTASAPSYTTDDMNGIILDTYNTGNPYPRYFSFIAKAGGNTDSNIGFWTESVGGSPTEKVRISNKGTLFSGGTIPSDLATYSSSLRGREGVLGPIFYWPRSYGTHSNGSGYDNVAEGGRLTLRMHGAQGGTAAMFQGGFDFGYGSGGETKNYNRLRVFFRVTRSGTSYTTGNVTFKLQSYYYTSGWADISNSNWDFNGTDSERGYRWTSSNWISTSDLQGGTDVPSIAIKYDNDNGNTGNSDMRIAAVYFQYAYFN